MAEVHLTIAGSDYAVACRDGEEDHLRRVGALVNEKTAEALGSIGSTSEVRRLLFAALLLGDELLDARQRPRDGASAAPAADPDVAGAALDALEGVAGRLESLAARLEQRGANG